MNCSKDFVGNELQVGDNVAFVHKHYQELRKGKILKLNPKQATILDITEDRKTWRSYNCVIKI